MKLRILAAPLLIATGLLSAASPASASTLPKPHISDADFNSSTGELFLSGRLSPRAAVLAGYGVRSIYLNGVPAAPNTFFCDFNATATYIEYCTVFVPTDLTGIVKVTVQDAADGPLSNVVRFKAS
jgi:hypothetical protein